MAGQPGVRRGELPTCLASYSSPTSSSHGCARSRPMASISGPIRCSVSWAATSLTWARRKTYTPTATCPTTTRSPRPSPGRSELRSSAPKRSRRCRHRRCRSSTRRRSMYTVHKSIKLSTSPRCLECGKQLDSAAGVAEGPECEMVPQGGDATVCIDCGHIMMYTDDQMLRNPTDEEVVQLAGNPAILAIMKGRAAYERYKAAKAVPGGSPPGDPGHGAPGGDAPRVSGANGQRQDGPGSDDC